jgi:hypothetical protein
MKNVQLILSRYLEETVTRIQTETVESDVSFGGGEYKLSDEGKQSLQEFIERTFENKKNFIDQYPGEAVIIKIKTIGYTDEIRVIPESDLYKELIKGVEDEIPDELDKIWGVLNQRLSEFRAREIAEYIKQHIRETVPENSLLQLEFEPFGRGQEIPPGVNPPYPKDDPRRRICKIYSYVTLKW